MALLPVMISPQYRGSWHSSYRIFVHQRSVQSGHDFYIKIERWLGDYDTLIADGRHIESGTWSLHTMGSASVANATLVLRFVECSTGINAKRRI